MQVTPSHFEAECAVCFDTAKMIVFAPCGHGLCLECTVNLAAHANVRVNIGGAIAVERAPSDASTLPWGRNPVPPPAYPVGMPTPNLAPFVFRGLFVRWHYQENFGRFILWNHEAHVAFDPHFGGGELPYIIAGWLPRYVWPSQARRNRRIEAVQLFAV